MKIEGLKELRNTALRVQIGKREEVRLKQERRGPEERDDQHPKE